MPLRRTLPPVVLALLLTAALGVAARAQSEPSDGVRENSGAAAPAPAEGPDAAGASGEAAPNPDGPAPPPVDENALRYFARQGDLDRLEAEVRRLKTLYPSWEPPADLFDPTAVRGSDVQPLWDLFQAGRYAEAREAIARRRRQDPNWTPPADLLAQLATAEARERLVNASDSKQWNTVLAIAAETPTLLVCANIDVLWRVGAAFAGAQRLDRARDLYVYILQNCQDENERLATMDKALAELPPEMTEELFRYARPQADGRDEFATIRLNLIREEVGAANESPDATVSPDDLALLEVAARETSSANDPILLGFYYYRHGDPAVAVEWFELALQRGGSAKAAEGAVLALRAAGRDRDAEPIAYEWRNATRENMVAYITLLTALLTGEAPGDADQGIVDRFATVVGAERSALGAQALGWYAYNAGQADTALAWFTQSMQWQPSEVGAFGVGLTLQRLRDAAGFQTFVAEWTPEYPRLPALFEQNQTQSRTRASAATVAGLARPATAAARPALPAVRSATAPSPAVAPSEPQSRAAPAGSPMDLVADADGPATTGSVGVAAPAGSSRAGNARCVATTDAAARTGKLTTAAALTRGWCLMELDRPREAAAAFDVALTAAPGSKTARDAAYGKSLAYLRLGLVDQAAVAAAQAPQGEVRRAQLGAEILTQRALAAYESGRYVETLMALDERARIVPDTLDLMLLRGWCYFNLDDLESARRLFEAVDRAQPSSKAKGGINAIRQRTTRKQS